MAEWNAHGPTGGFASSNRIAPCLIPPNHLRKLPRRICALVVQCRTLHLLSVEYYARHVSTEEQGCSYGAQLQSRAHILKDFMWCEQYQHILCEAVPNLARPKILGTAKGIQALGDFIAASRAFTKIGYWNAEELQELREHAAAPAVE